MKTHDSLFGSFFLIIAFSITVQNCSFTHVDCCKNLRVHSLFFILIVISDKKKLLFLKLFLRWEKVKLLHISDNEKR